MWILHKLPLISIETLHTKVFTSKWHRKGFMHVGPITISNIHSQKNTDILLRRCKHLLGNSPFKNSTLPQDLASYTFHKHGTHLQSSTSILEFNHFSLFTVWTACYCWQFLQFKNFFSYNSRCCCFSSKLCKRKTPVHFQLCLHPYKTSL